MVKLRSLRAQARSCLGGCLSKRIESRTENEGSKHGMKSFQVHEQTARTPSSARIQANIPKRSPSTATDDEDFSACWQMQPIAKLYMIPPKARGDAVSFRTGKGELYPARSIPIEDGCRPVEPFIGGGRVSVNQVGGEKISISCPGIPVFKSWEPESLQLSQDHDSICRPSSSFSAASDDNLTSCQAAERNMAAEGSSVDDFRQSVFYKDLNHSIELIGESLPGPMGFPAYCQAVLHINRAIHQEGRRFTYDVSKRNIMRRRPEAAHIYANMELEDWDALNTSLPPGAG